MLREKIQAIVNKYPRLKNLQDRTWRLNNLYHIKDKDGKHLKFQPNWAQHEILKDFHNFELVLKCRQIGITTFFTMICLDAVLWEDNIQAGIIAQTLDDTKNIFRDKLKYAFDHLDPVLRPLFHAIGDSKTELCFNHGSTIRVGTSMRSSTLQYLHISEFGKICVQDPLRAREIITGALNTVHLGQHIFIESTAEGKEGFFYNMCQEAQRKQYQALGPMDYRFRFFPWYKEQDYAINQHVEFDEFLLDYFAALDNKGIHLNGQQKAWYAIKWNLLREDMTREYPSYPEEAFSASQEGFWYSRQMRELHQLGHITDISYDKGALVHTAWDLGQREGTGDTAIWFFQIKRSGEVHIIDYFQRADCPLDQLAMIIKSKPYSYGTHIWPFDARQRDKAGITFEQQARAYNLSGVVLEPHGVIDGINLARTTMSRCWFDAKRCNTGISALENYKKKWNTQIGGYTSTPVKDSNTHGADAFRYLCAGMRLIEQNDGPISNDMRALKNYFRE